MPNSVNKHIFREVQKIRETKFGMILFAVLLITSVLVLFGLLTKTDPDGVNLSEIVALVATMLFIFGFAYFAFTAKLVAEVRENELFIRFYPLAGRTIDYKDITSCSAIKYNPIADYGGWGIRYGSSGKAYTISGGEGVQLALAQDKPLLLGSRRAAELANAINSNL